MSFRGRQGSLNHYVSGEYNLEGGGGGYNFTAPGRGIDVQGFTWF